MMTIIKDGGGGCGKPALSTDVLLPLLDSVFHPDGVLRRAPSNTHLLGLLAVAPSTLAKDYLLTARCERPR